MGRSWLYFMLRNYAFCNLSILSSCSRRAGNQRCSPSSHFMESLYGISTIKALNLKERRSQHWLNINIEACNAGIKQTRFDMLFSGINTFITAIDQVAVLWLGAIMVIDNNMTLGMFMAFNAYRGQFSQRASSLVDLCMQLRMLSYITNVCQRSFSANRNRSFPQERFFCRLGCQTGSQKFVLSI